MGSFFVGARPWPVLGVLGVAFAAFGVVSGCGSRPESRTFVEVGDAGASDVVVEDQSSPPPDASGTEDSSPEKDTGSGREDASESDGPAEADARVEAAADVDAGREASAEAEAGSKCTLLDVDAPIAVNSIDMDGTVVSDLGGSDSDFVEINVWDFSTPHDSGTFVLGEGDEATIGSCTHCVKVIQDDYLKIFFARSGTLEIDNSSDPPATILTLSDVELVEYDIGDDKVVDEESCLRIPFVQWRLDSCASSDDCTGADAVGPACNPDSLYCVPEACQQDAECTGFEQRCLFQGDYGVCYRDCDPSDATACDELATCSMLDFDPTSGYCVSYGTGDANDTCTLNGQTTSGCEENYYCYDDGSGARCRELCNFWEATVACADAGQACSIEGLCRPNAADSAALLATCAGTAAEGDFCGVGNGKFEGACVTDTGSTKICRKYCRLSGSDCDAGETCTDNLSISNVGTCIP